MGNTGDVPDFWGLSVMMNHRIDADYALSFGCAMMI